MESNYENPQEKFIQKRKEIINKFVNGQEKYLNSPTYHEIIDALVHSYDPYQLIDLLVNTIEKQRTEIVELKINDDKLITNLANLKIAIDDLQNI